MKIRHNKNTGQWFVVVNGGHVNRDYIAKEERLLEGIPDGEEPKILAEWTEWSYSDFGEGCSTYRNIGTRDGKVLMTIRRFEWFPAHGYSWDESWERIEPQIRQKPEVEEYEL